MPDSMANPGLPASGVSIAHSVGKERGVKVTSQLRQIGLCSGACATQSQSAFQNAVAVPSPADRAVSHLGWSDRRMIVQLTNPPALIQNDWNADGCGFVPRSCILTMLPLSMVT